MVTPFRLFLEEGTEWEPGLKETGIGEEAKLESSYCRFITLLLGLI